MTAVETIGVLFVMTVPIAIVAVIYSYVLTRPSMIFDRVYDYLERKLPEKLFMPVIGCHLCVSGQMSLYLFPFLVCPVIDIKYNFFLHLYFISATIFMAAFIKYIYVKLETETIYEGQEKAELTSEPEEVKTLKRK